MRACPFTPASLKSFRSDRCQSPTADFGCPSPDQNGHRSSLSLTLAHHVVRNVSRQGQINRLASFVCIKKEGSSHRNRTGKTRSSPHLEFGAPKREEDGRKP